MNVILPNENSLLNPFNIFGSIFNVNFICSLQVCKSMLLEIITIRSDY